MDRCNDIPLGGLTKRDQPGLGGVAGFNFTINYSLLHHRRETGESCLRLTDTGVDGFASG